jgi:hypothetical protein
MQSTMPSVFDELLDRKCSCHLRPRSTSTANPVETMSTKSIINGNSSNLWYVVFRMSARFSCLTHSTATHGVHPFLAQPPGLQGSLVQVL